MNNIRGDLDTKWLWLIIAITSGVALRLFALDQQSLWLDEMTSIQIAQKTWDQIVIGQGHDHHTPPFYYLLLHLWGRFIPLTEFGLRLFSVSVDAVNMVLVGLLCSRFISKDSSLLVVSAYALSPFAVYYAQEGRMYTLAVLFALLYTLAIERLVRSKGSLLLWAVTAGFILALGIYTHYYLVLYAFSVISLSLYVARRSYMRVTFIVLSGLLAILLFAPWIPMMLQLARGEGQTFRTHIFSVVPYTFFRFVIGYGVFPLNMGAKEDLIRSAVAHGFYLVAVFGSVLLLALTSRGRANTRNPLKAAAGWVLLTPIMVGLIISLKVPMLSERYLIVVFPVFLLLCLGFQNLSRKRSVMAVGSFFLMLLIGDIAYFYNPHFGKAQWRDSALYVAQSLGSSGAVFVEPDYAAPVFRHYFRGPQPVHALRLSDLAKDLADAESRLQQDLDGHRRIVLITSGPASPETGYGKLLIKYAEKREIKIFELETGIICTTWELVKDETHVGSTSS